MYTSRMGANSTHEHSLNSLLLQLTQIQDSSIHSLQCSFLEFTVFGSNYSHAFPFLSHLWLFFFGVLRNSSSSNNNKTKRFFCCCCMLWFLEPHCALFHSCLVCFVDSSSLCFPFSIFLFSYNFFVCVVHLFCSFFSLE